MKPSKILSVFAFILWLTAATFSPAREPASPPAMLVASYSKNAAFLVNAEGRIVWEYKMPGNCQDAWLLPSGNILLCGGNQVREVTPGKKVVWEYTGPKDIKTQIHNCQPLPGGRTLIGENGACRLLELDRKGQIVKELKLKLGGDAHTQMRQVRKTAEGTYLVCARGENNFHEDDADGRQIRQILGSEMNRAGVDWPALHSAIRLKNGNLLIGGGYKAPVIEIDKDNRIVWKLTAADIPEVGFTFAAGCLRLDNGNTVVAAFDSKFQIFEVTPDKKIVWKVQNPAIGQPTHVKLLKSDDLERFVAQAGK